VREGKREGEEKEEWAEGGRGKEREGRSLRHGFWGVSE